MSDFHLKNEHFFLRNEYFSSKMSTLSLKYWYFPLKNVHFSLKNAISTPNPPRLRQVLPNNPKSQRTRAKDRGKTRNKIQYHIVYSLLFDFGNICTCGVLFFGLEKSDLDEEAPRPAENARECWVRRE